MFETEDGELYEDMLITCNWNKSWTPKSQLDKCSWIACINPPQVGSPKAIGHHRVHI